MEIPCLHPHACASVTKPHILWFLMLMLTGYDRYGNDKYGYNKDGYHRYGYHKDGE
jgi:hypothetical protein